MIVGIGNDIIEVYRIEKAIARLQERFLDRVFTFKEQEYCNQFRDKFRRYAGRFAAKEAIVKSLGTGIREGISWLDIEIVNQADGKPIVVLSNSIRQRFAGVDTLVSISHCHDYATAFSIAYIPSPKG